MEHSSLSRDVVSFFDSLYLADSAACSTSLYRGFLARYGFDTFACGDYDALDLAKSRYIATGWPKDFANFYYGEQKLSPDPVRKVIPSATAPITWSDLLASGATSREMKRSVDMSDHFGWRESLIVPLGPVGRRRAIVSLKGAREPLKPHERSLLSMAAVLFYQRLSSFSVPAAELQRPAVLTGREIDCLSHVAMGLSEQEMADRLDIAKSTVHEYVENARRKLGASNRAHAVAIALTRKLISM